MNSNSPNVDSRIELVIRAALAMQRWPWEQGVVAQAMLELGRDDLVVLLAHDAVVNQYKDGRLAMKNDRHAAVDPAVNGEPVLHAWRITGDQRYKVAADRMLDYMLYRCPRTREGIHFHNENEGQIWVDACYMGPPFLAIAGHPKEAVRQLLGYKRILWNDEHRLLSHRWDDDLKTMHRAAYWGVGNGWTLAGIARVLRVLPAEMSDERESLIEFGRTLVDSLLGYQRPDRFFHDVVNDPQTFVETNLSQMLAYTIYRGVDDEWLPREYLEHAESTREAVLTKVDSYGLVQDVCGGPHFDHPGTAAEGQAFFLLMEAARSRR